MESKSRAHAKISKKVVLWYVAWGPCKYATEMGWMHQALQPYYPHLKKGTNYEKIIFAPWDFQEVRLLIEQVCRRRGPPEGWYLGNQPIPADWTKRRLQ